MDEKNKRAVLLVNLGSPNTYEQVGEFIFNLFFDKHILNMNPFSRYILARLISFIRKKKSQKKFMQIGGSPLLEISKNQSCDLQNLLPHNYHVFYAMRYSEPSIKNVINEIINSGRESLLVIPLFPHFSNVTAKSVFDEVDNSIKKNKKTKQFKVIKVERLYKKNLYLEALSKTVIDAINKNNFALENLTILLSAHNMPKKKISMGDPYRSEVEDSAVLLKDRLIQKDTEFKNCKYRLGFQSRILPFMWLYPTIEELLLKEAEKKREVLIVPISFVAENLETLYDIDIYLKGLSEKIGIPKFARAEALNVEPIFIDCLKEIVISRFKEYGL